MKIGIYAGTFDPIHNGHTEFARKAISEAKLDRVIVVAEKEPYRKKPRVRWDHRQAMIERATQDIEAADHDYRFSALLAKQCTIADTLSQAEAHYGVEHTFWFLVGSDVFEHMHQWRDVVHNSQYGGFVVSLRDEHDTTWLNEKKCSIQSVQNFSLNTVVLSNDHPHVSSSGIRRAIAEGSFTSDISVKVFDYIHKHRLYHKNLPEFDQDEIPF